MSYWVMLYKVFCNYRRKKKLMKYNQYMQMFTTLMENKPLVELFDEMQGDVSYDICTAGALVLNVAV